MRYSDEKITEALQLWDYAKDYEPHERSIKSRLYLPDADRSKEPINTSLIVFKKYSLLPFLSFPSHYYIVVDGLIFHPGFNDSQDIYNNTTSKYDTKTVGVREECHYCVYKNMKKYFINDLHFNIATNNCQIILGTFKEFFSLLGVFIALVLLSITGDMIYIFLLLIIIAINLFTYIHRPMYFTKCIHIDDTFNETRRLETKDE